MKYIQQKPFVVIIYGPTGVGKTEIALSLAQHIPAEIINMDMGQLYAPFSIGTAKPDWKNSIIPHHLFDVIETPLDYTVTQYRSFVLESIDLIIKNNKIPILVGGSGFYLRSLLFPPKTPFIDTKNVDASIKSQRDDLWKELYEIDPERALSIHQSDTYRIKRALSIWHHLKIKPSSCMPTYDPPFNFLLLYITRDRDELYARINERVNEMIDQGWIKEAESLISTPWKEFIYRKKIIGYKSIFDYLDNKSTYKKMVDDISTDTRHYAKRQITFWRKLEKELYEEIGNGKEKHSFVETVDLTSGAINLYINQLLDQYHSLLRKKYE